MTLHDWFPGLECGGPWRQHFRERGAAGVAIADLSCFPAQRGERELTVEFLTGGRRRRAQAVLVRWALFAGYRRVWFENRVADLQGELAPMGKAEITCPTCGAHWDDDHPGFWSGVREFGCFPRTWLLCGGELPQWEVGRRRT